MNLEPKQGLRISSVMKMLYYVEIVLYFITYSSSFNFYTYSCISFPFAGLPTYYNLIQNARSFKTAP